MPVATRAKDPGPKRSKIQEVKENALARQSLGSETPSSTSKRSRHEFLYSWLFRTALLSQDWGRHGGLGTRALAFQETRERFDRVRYAVRNTARDAGETD